MTCAHRTHGVSTRAKKIARENCKNLAQVDLSATSIKAINEHAFSHCVSQQHVWLPATLQEIHAEAFAHCEALEMVDIPPALR